MLGGQVPGAPGRMNEKAQTRSSQVPGLLGGASLPDTELLLRPEGRGGWVSEPPFPKCLKGSESTRNPRGKQVTLVLATHTPDTCARQPAAGGQISSRDAPGTSWPAVQLCLPASVRGADVPSHFSLSRPEDGRSTWQPPPHLQTARRSRTIARGLVA